MNIKLLSILTSCLCLLSLFTAKADYTVYPVPQSATYQTGSLPLGTRVNVVVEKGIDQYTLDRAKEVLAQQAGITFTFADKASSKVPNIYLGIKGSGGVADKYAVKQGLDLSVFDVAGKFDRHIIVARQGAKQPEVVVLGEHTNAVFYALASLEQILEQADGNTLAPFAIADYADMEYRGIVEGYYGYPYTFDAKKDIIDFFKRYKMNTYLYGAKSDPYHSGFWRDPYPETITAQQEKNGWLSQQMLADLAEQSLRSKVNFIWAIHPNSGKAVDYHTAESTKQAVSDVMDKFELMHQLGIRQFAVFLDDAGWNFSDVNNYRDFLTNLQDELDAKYNRNYTNASDTVLPLHFVPHIYAINFARPQDLKTYFDAISQTDPKIVVYTTGSGVWSSVNNSDFETMNELMKRPVALWWNYPCNDNKDGRIYTADMYSNLQEMGLPLPVTDAPLCLGITANPMQQGSIAKIGMFGIADYTWNTSAFNTTENWHAAFPAIVGKTNEALYNYLARYLRYQDPEEMKTLTQAYINGSSDGKALADTLRALRDASRRMLNTFDTSDADPMYANSRHLVLRDARPWLNKLGAMCDIAITLLDLDNTADESQRWLSYCQQVKAFNDFKTDTLYLVDALEGMGENPPSELHRVEPSHQYLMPFIEWLIANKYQFAKPAATEEGGADTKQVAYSQIAVSPYQTTLSPGEKLFVTLPQGGLLESATLSDDIFKRFDVAYSLHGKTFTPAKNIAQLQGQQAMYLTFTPKGKKAQNITLSSQTLSVSMPQAPQVSHVDMPRGRPWDNHTADKLVDGDYRTFACLYRDQRDGDAYTLTLSETQPVYDVTMVMGTTNGDFAKVANVQISNDSVNWTSLTVTGTDVADMRLSMPQIKKLNQDVSVCTFQGTGQQARYVRFYVKESFQERWIRLYEMEVNAQHVASQYVNTATAGSEIVSAVYDNNPSTSHTLVAGTPLVYNIVSLQPSATAIVYANGTGTAKATATSDTNTVSLPDVKPGVNYLDLSQLPDATKITIEGDKLSIAQIVIK